MARQVALPDGRTLDVPDDATPEQLTALKDKLRTRFADHLEKPTESIPKAAEPEPAQPEESLGSKASRFVQGALTGGHTFEDLGRGIGVIKENPGKLADLAEQQVRSATAPVGGDTVAAAGSFAAGKGFDPGAQRERRQALEEEMGTAATMIPKTLGGVGGFGRTPGGPVVSSAVGGAVAGVNEKGSFDNVAGDAALGAAGGKLAEGATKLVGAGVDRAVSMASRIAGVQGSTIPKAVRVLADRLKIDPRELVVIRDLESQNAGRPVSWAEAADPKTVERIRGMSLSRPDMAQEAGAAAAAASDARPGNLRNFVENGQMTGTADAALAARTQNFTDMMARLGNRQVRINNPGDFDRTAVTRGLHDLAGNAPPAVRQSLNNFLQAIGTSSRTPVHLRLRDVEDVRQAVASAIEHDPALETQLSPVRDELRRLAETQVGGYGAGMRNFERLGDLADGITQGGKAASPTGSTVALEETMARASQSGENGARIGFRSRLSDDMLNSNGKAPEKYVGQGFRERAEMAMGPQEAGRLERGFRVENKAARNLDRLDTAPGKVADVSGDVSLATKAAAAATGRFSGGAIADLVTKSYGKLRSFGLSNRAARDLSRSFFSADPVQVNIAARQLVRLGVIKDIKDKAGAIAALTGSQTAVAAAE